MSKTIKIQCRYGEQEVPAPTTHPDINNLWFLWRIWGWIWRRIKNKWNKAECGTYNEEQDKFIISKWYRKISDYIWDGPRDSKLRKLLWKLDQQRQFGCPNCGDERWIDIEFEHKDYFECTSGGTGNNPTIGKYHWWEGWKTCPRCGYREWIYEESC